MGGNLDLLMKGAGTVVSTMGQFQTGKSARRVGRANAQPYYRNADTLDTDAGLTEALAQRRYIETKEQGRYMTGRQVAVVGASGGGMDDPTVLNIIAKTQARNEMDAMYELWHGYNEAESKRNEAQMQRYAGQISEYEGDMEYRASKTRGLSTLMTGMYSVYETANKRKQQRPKGTNTPPAPTPKPKSTLTAGAR